MVQKLSLLGKVFTSNKKGAYGFTKGFANIKNGNRSKLLFPNRNTNDEFILSFRKMCRGANYFGAMAGAGGRAAKIWAAILFMSLATVVISSLLTLVKAMARLSMKNGASISAKTAGFLFYLNSLMSLLLTWNLGSQWRRFLEVSWLSTSRKISAAEKYLGARSPEVVSIRRQVFTVALGVSVFSVLEHFMSIMSTTGLSCTQGILRCYTLNSHGFLLNESDYSVPLALVIFIVSNVATFIWNVQDLIIILISMGMTHNYKRITRHISKITEQLMKTDNAEIEGEAVKHWRIARELIARQAALVKQVDDATGPLTLLCIMNNIYFICLQLYFGIGANTNVLDACYFFISLMWLCARAAGVVLIASTVNYNSNQTLQYTFSCPSDHFNIEVQRLQGQLCKDHVALTGMKFFSITREFLLKVAGAIATYEVFILQFQDD